MSTEDSWIGSTIEGRYTIDKRIARGGMSTVYLARDRRLHRDVAIKVLFPHMATDRKVVQRFEQEARNSALIAHQNVVQVLDQGQTRETAYMVMEYVPGATLRTLLKRGPMTPRLTLAYAHAILSGLSAAHQAGLVHRDIKPENVLVSPEGRIKLADFGLARAATHNSGTSTLMGTVAYISPELLSGEGADERADIYAVGILLYEMLTGVQPYTGDSPVRVAFQHVNSTVPAPSAYVPGLPQQLDQLVRHATRIDPDERPKNAAELLNAVDAVREELTPEELNFDGAVRSHRHSEPAEDTAATQMLGADATEQPTHAWTAAQQPAGFPEDEETIESAEVADSGEPSEISETDHDATQVFPQEDFPTAEDSSWEDDVTTALDQGRESEFSSSRGPHQRNWDTLAEEERQTVAEVPLPQQLSVREPETAVHRRVSSPHATGTRTSYDPGADRRTRQRPLHTLQAPAPSRQGIAVAVVMILLAVLMLISYQIGVSDLLIPPLGGR